MVTKNDCRSALIKTSLDLVRIVEINGGSINTGKAKTELPPENTYPFT